MKMNMYKEPEFKVVMTANEDIITASTASNTLDTVSSAWDPSQSGSGSGGVGFGL